MAPKIISQTEPGARSRVFAGAKILSDAVRITMGPRGRHALLQTPSGAPTITKDGATIARAIDLPDSFENMGAQMVRQVALDTAEEAGDGTTTATVLAEAILREGLKAITAGVQPLALKRGIDRAVASVIETLQRLSRPCRDQDIAGVGAIAANADPDIGAMLARALERVGRSGVVTIEEARGLEDELSVIQGMQIDRGYLAPQFISDPKTQSTTFENCRILLCNQRITHIREMLPILEAAAKAGTPLLIAADEVEGEARATLVVNFIRGTLKVVAIRAPGFGDQRADLLQDIAILTGGTIVGPGTGTTLEKVTLDQLGRADRVVIEANRTTFAGGGGAAGEIRARAAQLERAANHATSDYEKDRLRERVAKLSGGIAIIRVGGKTEVELKERRARYEDAHRATRAAIEEGVVPGGGTSLLRAQQALSEIEPMARDEEAGIAVLGYALEEPLWQLAENSERDGSVVIDSVRSGKASFGFDAASRDYVDMFTAGIVDAAKVTRIALQNAASVAGTLLTADVFITDAPPAGVAAAAPTIGLLRGSFGQRRNVVRSAHQFRPRVDPSFALQMLPEARERGAKLLLEQADDGGGADFALDEAADAGPETDSTTPPDRFINTCFTPAGSQTPLPHHRSLVAGRAYQLRVDIGPYRTESLDKEPQAFPEDALPDNSEGHWLELIAASDELLTDAVRGWLYLPKQGGSWVCDCKPGGAHICKPGDRKEFLWVPLHASQRAGHARLRLGLYHERNLLQSQILTATITETETDVEDPADAITDYRITAGLGEVPTLPARTLNILTNDNDDSTHRLVINQDKGNPLSYSFTEGQVGRAMDVVRQTLVDIHLKVTPPTPLSAGRKDNLYDASNSKALPAYQADLRTLALRGRKLWAALAGDRESMQDLARRLASKASIQVSRTAKSRLVFPWALVYDYPIDTEKEEAHVFCEFTQNWYDRKASTKPERDIPDQCPFAATHKVNTICPYGFWGMRHVIEQPPSMPKNRTLPVTIEGASAATMVVGLSQDLDSSAHLRRMTSGIRSSVQLDARKTLQGIRDALDKRPALELLYFYCHGRHLKQEGRSPEETYLEVGLKEAITSEDFTTWNALWSLEHWRKTSPLVVINGCHTTDMTPGALSMFVEAFVNAYASGVIGTETTIHEDVASEAAELLFRHLCGEATGQPVGEAIRRMRFQLLRKGNVMGLTYTAYCSASLVLSQGSSQ